ncbi:MutS2 family protein [Desulfurispirillum indicum S5]|uniref:Endonuclease MutS2 n=1 Tax=Desulfurispirillum indicum (strain ATCC BAA-1389 / DSM 22839 / S5) TaxID=653733 RepID=E6W278_DESIS|nr:endonuclease MutS2 [Desulfurispirillum indicum]ADU65536.1 MutS2 family protein [Desulfurispirillum indicum S5]
MTTTNHALAVLEYARLKELLKEFTVSSLGKRELDRLEPAHSYLDVRSRHAISLEFYLLNRDHGGIPFGPLYDPLWLWEKIGQKGELLEPGELLQVARFLLVVKGVKAFLAELAGDTFVRSREMGGDLHPCADLKSRIELCIEEGGQISDSASPNLKRIRRELRTARSRVKKQMERYLSDAQYKDIIIDPIITIRRDRYVIPLRSNFKGKIDGIVQDHSASGGTFFVEPKESVELNNRLAELQAGEREEEYRIIRELGELVQSRLRALQENTALLARMDMYTAFARYAIRYHGTFLEPSQHKGCCLPRLRHPLLKNPVPVDAYLGGEHPSMLLITGPNTGGKTIALKSLGLAVLSHNSGMPVLCSEVESFMGYFDSVFADIGDEQSIEQNLSTFSGHIVNIAHVAGNATERSLVLLDELGSGTDPEEGGALAVGILEYFRQRKCSVVATTHHNAVKRYAFTTGGIGNACMEFDLQTLQPTYRILYGYQGESSALAIAQRHGLPGEILETSRNFLESQSGEEAKTIAALERKLEKFARRSDQFERESRELKEKLRTVTLQQQNLDSEAQHILQQATMQARDILRQARREADGYIKKLKDTSVRQHAEAQAEFNQLSRQVYAEADRMERSHLEKPLSLEPGQRVFVAKLQRDGTIVSRSGKSVQVEVGGMTIKSRADELFAPRDTQSPTPAASEGRKSVSNYQAPATSVKPELLLVGKRVEEALDELEKYISSAAVAERESVRIVHGLGSGRLKRAVREYLQQSPLVKELRDGEAFEGGLGATVVQLT